MKIIRILAFLLIGGAIVLAFVYPPPMSGQTWSEASRIFYFHVPQALVSFISFGVAMVYAVLYLRKKDLLHDERAALAVELGIVFCILATVTGSIFAKVAWGEFWNWDPRETSILLLLMVYGAYFALRQSVSDPRRRATFSSVYLVLAFATVPFFGFVLPRLYQSLHPTDTLVADGGMAIHGYVALVFYMSMAGFTVLFAWLFNIGNRLLRLKHMQLEKRYVD